MIQLRPKAIAFTVFGLITLTLVFAQLYRSPPPPPAPSRAIVTTTTTTSSTTTIDGSLFGDYRDPLLFQSLPPQHGAYHPFVPRHNIAPVTANRTRTPLMIPFTRNHKILLQCILSYIAAGWPREDIIVVDNSGTMTANLKNELGSKNPFYLPYATLRETYGVNILRTPTLLTFSQLQNFMMATAMSYSWPYYYWGHSDVAVLSWEDKTPYKSFWVNTVDKLTELLLNGGAKGKEKDWGVRLFNSDYLTLINTAAMGRIEGGGWDVFIPYYFSDCDFWARVRFSGLTIVEEQVGDIFDLNVPVSHPEEEFFEGFETVNGKQYQKLREELRVMEKQKKEGVRNSWQDSVQGKVGESWTYGEGFQKAWWEMSSLGGHVYEKKWNTSECELRGLRTNKDIWNW